MIDEKALREWMRRVEHGEADPRTFLRTLTALGVSGPLIGSLLVGLNSFVHEAWPSASERRVAAHRSREPRREPT